MKSPKHPCTMFDACLTRVGMADAPQISPDQDTHKGFVTFGFLRQYGNPHYYDTSSKYIWVIYQGWANTYLGKL